MASQPSRERARMASHNDQASPTPCLSEKDVPGASLKGRKPEQLKVPELKLWLSCRGAPTRGRKAELVERYGKVYVGHMPVSYFE